MNFLRLLPVFISFLLLCAHLLFHTSQTAIAIIPLFFLIPLMFRKTWVPCLTQLVLLVAAVEWLRTVVFEVLHRMSAGEPWIRYSIILGAVALFTALSSLVFRNKALGKRYSDAGITDQE